ncbi:NAD(P)/FAD-dependent oxidoreductase [Romboutsia sp.]|uniref:NAD(P)/FAD-dependent oxidoreductase n=1 Tax=Romboutsia sp. TaxID=1965302 RepID=UPI003F2BFE63
MLDKLKNVFKGKQPTKYVVLGASAAGINAVKTLRELDKEADIILISKDEKIYSRCMLHHVISNHKTVEEINFVEEKFIDDNKIKWIKNQEVKGIDEKAKLVELEGKIIEYDKLLIATGASSFIPPIKNLRDGNFVYAVRNIEDIYKIKEKASKSKNVAIIGAGLVGIDAVAGLMDYENLNVSLVYTEPFVLNKQLDKYTASTYENKFLKKGVKLYPNSKIQEISLKDNKDVKGIKLENDILVECDMIIVATGVSPSVEFVNNTKIECDRGIVINDKCETTVENIYAAGDVVGKNAIWPLAVKQGITAAYNMAGVEKQINDSFAFKNSMNFMGIATVSLGIVNPIDESYKVVTRCDGDDYKKFIYKDDVIYGVVAQGDISYTGALAYLIKNNVKIPNIEDRIFDIGYGDFLTLKENGEFCYSL